MSLSLLFLSLSPLKFYLKRQQTMAEFGCICVIDWSKLYVSDSGGGVPAAAKVLGIPRNPCLLHSLETGTGRALMQKGKVFQGSHQPGAQDAAALIDRVRGVVKSFSNATLKKEAAEDAAAALKEDLRAIDPDVIVPDYKIVPIDGPTRMKSIERMMSSYSEQQKNIDAYFTRTDPTSDKRLSHLEDQNVLFMSSVLKMVCFILTLFVAYV